MPRLSIPLISSAVALAGCLGDVPPFAGSGGAGTSSGATSSSGGGDASVSASGASEAQTAQVASSSVASSSVASGSSTTGTGGGCDFTEPPATCAEADATFACAGYGTVEECDPRDVCPDGVCIYPETVLPAGSTNDRYCKMPAGVSAGICLHCDGEGPAIAIPADFVTESDTITLATFGAEMGSTVKIVARGHGNFRLDCWDPPETVSSETYTLSDDYQGYEVLLPPSSPFELRILPMSNSLWMQIDCTYLVETASRGVAPEP